MINKRMLYSYSVRALGMALVLFSTRLPRLRAPNSMSASSCFKSPGAVDEKDADAAKEELEEWVKIYRQDLLNTSSVRPFEIIPHNYKTLAIQKQLEVPEEICIRKGIMTDKGEISHAVESMLHRSWVVHWIKFT